MSTINASVEVVPILRSALLSQIGVPAGELDEASTVAGMERLPDSFLQPLEDIDRHRAVLDLIGWSEHAPLKSVSLDRDAHRSVITRAMRARLAIERDYMDVNPALKGAVRQRQRARRYARIIERFLLDNKLADE